MLAFSAAFCRTWRAAAAVARSGTMLAGGLDGVRMALSLPQARCGVQIDQTARVQTVPLLSSFQEQGEAPATIRAGHRHLVLAKAEEIIGLALQHPQVLECTSSLVEGLSVILPDTSREKDLRRGQLQQSTPRNRAVWSRQG